LLRRQTNMNDSTTAKKPAVFNISLHTLATTWA
jgi:hypothetical protein